MTGQLPEMHQRKAEREIAVDLFVVDVLLEKETWILWVFMSLI